MSVVGNDSTEKSIVSFGSKIAVCWHFTAAYRSAATRRQGATENARHENTGRSKMQGWKMRDMNLRHQIAGVENARHENAGPICKGGKCGKS